MACSNSQSPIPSWTSSSRGSCWLSESDATHWDVELKGERYRSEQILSADTVVLFVHDL